MHSFTPSFGPIRSKTPIRAGYRDTAAPYPSPSSQATPQTPRRRASSPVELISATSSQILSPGIGLKDLESMSNLSPTLTPASVSSLDAPAAFASDLTFLLDEPSLQLRTSDGPVIPAQLCINPLDVGYNLGRLDQTSLKLEWGRSYKDVLLFVPPVAQTTPVCFSRDAPTTDEYARNRFQEHHDIMKVKKPRSEPGKMIKGVRSITGYTDEEQSYMYLMRVIMFYFWFAQMPWVIEDGIVIDYAKAYLKKHTKINVEEVITEPFAKTIRSDTSRLRGEGKNLILTQVKRFWSLEEGDVVQIEYLQEEDRFAYLDRNKETVQLYNTELIGDVMTTLMFGTSKKIGILFLDKMLEDDNPEELDRVFRAVARPGLDLKPEIPTIVDPSPQARRGPSISAIAFTCIHIYHALERLKIPKSQGRKGRSKVSEFAGRDLEARWGRYVRELARQPELGEIRASLLKRMQAEYVKMRPRIERERRGNDFMW